MNPASTADRASIEIIVSRVSIADEVVVISGQNSCMVIFFVTNLVVKRLNY